MIPRRAFVASVALAVTIPVAGCSGAEPDGPATTGSTTATGTVTASGTGGTTEMLPATDDLDLRQANVVDVSFEGVPGESFRFEVTLFHDDDGEAGYANWWQVETLDGRQLGRRELLHAHSTAPFARSASVDVPAGIDCVVVRGHDQTHGYGGHAMLVNLRTGAMRAADQGPEPAAFDAADCP